MGFMGRKTAWEKEWISLRKREERFFKKQEPYKTSLINQKLQDVVPKQLQEKLDLAFVKAFEMVFEKGTMVIERTYAKEKWENQYKVNEFKIGLKQDRANIKAFSKQAGMANRKNLLLSGVEGAGLGILGIGLADIPLFVGVMLKSIYEIAISYGYPYETEEEQVLILKMIQAALAHGEKLTAFNLEVDEMLKGSGKEQWNVKEEMKKAAEMLSDQLLYTKFLQGIPIAGIVGGVWDAIYLKQVTDYAFMKYQRRFLQKNTDKRV